MATQIQTPLSCGLSLFEDGIKEYGDLIKNKDELIRFLICMVEANRFEYICENNIQEFFSNIDNHIAIHEECQRRFDPEMAYGIRAQGEI